MKFGCNGSFGEDVEKLVPDLVFEENFSTLHFEAGVKDLQGHLLIGWEVIDVFDEKFVFEEKLPLQLFNQFLH